MKRSQSNNGVLKLSADVTYTALMLGGFIDTDVKDSRLTAGPLLEVWNPYQ